MMSSKKTINSANEFAPIYDEYTQNSQWIGTDILFEFMSQHIKPNQTLLDIGIGTGLSSLPFQKAGLKIYGLDGSTKMISICRNKKIAHKLNVTDLSKNDVWFEHINFDHAISHGVFHLIGNLELIFKRTESLLKKDGYFGFTYEKTDEARDGYKETSTSGLFEFEHQTSGIKVYRHTEKHILDLLKSNQFQVLKKTEFLAFVDQHTKTKKHFNLIVAKKIL